MSEVLPASIYLTHSALLNGSNPVGRIKDTGYSGFAIDPSLDGYGFSLKTVSSSLNDPTISYASLLTSFNNEGSVFSRAVTDLYNKQSNYSNLEAATLNIIG